MNTRQSTSIFLTIILCVVLISPGISLSTLGQEVEKEIQYRQLSAEDYADKVEGGWVGQAIAVLWAQWTEFKWNGQMVPFELDDWYRLEIPIDTSEIKTVEDYQAVMKANRELANDKKYWKKWTPDKMSDQDDLYLEFMFLHSIQKNGLDVSAKEMAEDWLRYLDSNRIWCANKAAYQNFTKDIWPPLSGHPSNTIWGDAIDFQIEADLFGLISPGMPQVSNAWADKVGHMMNYGDGVYAGMAMAAMYSEAFFESDPVKLINHSLKAIPEESGYAQMIRDVIALHSRYPDWQDAWKELEVKWGEGKIIPGIGIDVQINGAYIYMGLLYGEGDFLKSMNVSMRCGRDSDCNPSSVAGILGTVLGMKGIPDKWAILRDLPIDNIAIRDIYPKSIDWDDIMESTLEVGKWNILENGGYLDKGIYYIPYTTPTATILEQTSWEPRIEVNWEKD
jgi:hypothetical protein